MRKNILIFGSIIVILNIIILVILYNQNTQYHSSQDTNETVKSTVPQYATGSDVYDCYNNPLRDYALTFVREAEPSVVEQHYALRAEITQIEKRYLATGDLCYTIYFDGPGKWRFSIDESDEGMTFARMMSKKLRDYVSVTFDDNCYIIDIK